MNIRINLCFFAYLVLSGCQLDTKLDYALELAGENRCELQKVLDHYSLNKDDTLQLRAALFLIENMPGHKTYYGKVVSNYYIRIDSILELELHPMRKRELIDSITVYYPDLDDYIVEDVKVINADYLIKNIDQAFVLWQSKTWNKGMTFNEFCEYLLPYKITEFQVIQNWRDSLSIKFDHEFRDDTPYPVFNSRFFPSLPAIYYSEAIKNKLGIYLTHYDHYGFFATSSLSRLAYGICDDYTTLGAAVLRSHGIPVVTEYIPSWTTADMGHKWFSILNKGKNIASPWGIESRPGDPFFLENMYPKVFRYTYAAEPKYAEYLANAKYIHPSITPFQKDITADYVRTSNLNIPVNNLNIKDKYVYIALFDNIQWTIVDIGVLNRKNANFENMGRGIVYLVFGYTGYNLIPISLPFLLDFDGSIKYFKSEENGESHSVRLTRKFPRKDIVETMEEKILGGKIQASNNKSFSDYKTFYTIDSLMFPDIAHFVNNDNYRYWRYCSPSGSNCNIAELAFFEKDSSNNTPVAGEIIGTINEISDNSPEWKKENAFDGNWLTMFQYAKEDGGWIGLDLGEPKCINRFRCVPRSDDNNIHYGDTYELLYWNNKWQSLGQQVAEEKYLIFNNVPKNALLLLKNNTQGKEERIFTYEDNKQIWQ